MGALQKTFFEHITNADDEKVKKALEELDKEVGKFIKPIISRGSQIRVLKDGEDLWIFQTVWFEGELKAEFEDADEVE